METDKTCAACSEAVGPGDAIGLWDGRWYCRACLEAECEGLADYASTHDRLEETTPFSVKACLRLMGYNALVATLFLAALGAIYGFSVGGARGALTGAIVLALVGAIFALCWLPLMAVAESTRRGTAVASDGIIGVRSARPRRRSFRMSWPTWTIDRPARSCRWCVLRNAYTGILQPKREQVIVLVIPIRLFGRDVLRRHVFCGFTSETFRLWRASLTLTGVPKIKPGPLFHWHPFSLPRGSAETPARRRELEHEESAAHEQATVA